MNPIYFFKICIFLEYSNEEIEEAICIIRSNAFQVISPTQECLTGLYVDAAMLNHTCAKANSRFIFGSNYEMKVIAISDIECGEEITLNYLDPFFTTIQRKAILIRGKSFECKCSRCMDPTEFDTYASR